MPTITNFGDVVTTGNSVVQGTGTSSFAGLVTFAQGFTTPKDVTVSSTLNSTNVVATGNVSGANLSSSGNIWASSNVNGANLYASGNVSGANFTSSGNVWAASNVNGTNLYVTGNIWGQNLTSQYNVWAASNVNGTNLYVTGNIWGQNLTSQYNVWAASNVNGANLYVTGNIWGQNLTSQYNVWAASNVNGANLYVTGNIWGQNLTSQYNVWAASNVNGTNVWASGNIVSSRNVWAASNVNGTNVWATGNISGANLVSSFNVWALSNLNGVNVWATGNISAASNINATNAWITGNLFAANVATGGFRSNTLNTALTSTLNLLGGLLISGSVAAADQTIVTTGSGAGIQWGTIKGSQWTTSGSDIYFSTGKVGVGTSTVTYPLTVSGTGVSAAAPYSNLSYQDGGWTQSYEPTAATTIKIYTDGKIGCTEVDVFSDRRIKTEIQDSDSSRDLDTIQRLRVREFKYKDPVEHGETTYTGLVAQEVKEVFPPAVSLHDGVIPDIFQVPISFSGRICQFKTKIESLSMGASVKVLDESVEKILKVVRVSDFEIEFDSEIEGPKVFVYGQTVKDLHTVSYDRLVPVLISAVQELAKKI